jgi:hypothetical protein
MAEDFCDLRLTAAAIDARHQFAQAPRLRNPGRSAAFHKPAIINELDLETAAGGRFLEHVRLEDAGLIPGRLPAHCRVEREHEPAAARRTESVDLAEEGIELGTRRGRGTAARFSVGQAGARHWRLPEPVFAHCQPLRRRS